MLIPRGSALRATLESMREAERLRIPHILREGRVRAGLSQAALAGRAGTVRSAICAYESGSRTPSLEVLARILAAMNLQLVLWTEPYQADVDREIDRVAGLSPLDRMRRVPFFCERLPGLMEGIPFAVDGALSALLQGVPALVKRVELVVPDDDVVLTGLAERLAIKATELTEFGDVAFKPGPETADFFREHNPTMWKTFGGVFALRVVPSIRPIEVQIPDTPPYVLPVVPLTAMEPRDPWFQRVVERVKGRVQES